MARALAAAARTRTNKVRMPRWINHASNAPGMAPSWIRSVFNRAQCSSSARVTSAPATRSEWPLRYFVAECITISAPNSKGRVNTGVATVESTASFAPAFFAISAVAARSVIVHSGLAGVSTQISFVLPGRTARAIEAVSPMSTSSTSRPQPRANVISQLRSDQYITLGTIT